MSNSAIKALYLVLEQTDSADVPNGALFLDAANGGALSQKTLSGAVGVIASAANSNPFIRQFMSGEAFSINKPLAIRADGKVILADSDTPARQVLIGHSLQTSLGDGSVINVLCIGTNLAGVLAGQGFNSGNTIFLGENPGEYTNNVSTFTGTNDAYIKVGIAVPPIGQSGTMATDLIVFTELIAID